MTMDTAKLKPVFYSCLSAAIWTTVGFLTAVAIIFPRTHPYMLKQSPLGSTTGTGSITVRGREKGHH